MPIPSWPPRCVRVSASSLLRSHPETSTRSSSQTAAPKQMRMRFASRGSSPGVTRSPHATAHTMVERGQSHANWGSSPVGGGAYKQGLRKLCDAHGILLIADEVMAGFGRTGERFSVDHWQVVPDLLTMAKGLTSAYVQLGAVGMRRHIAEHFEKNVFYLKSEIRNLRSESNRFLNADLWPLISVFVVPAAGIEPATFRSGGERSNPLSYAGLLVFRKR